MNFPKYLNKTWKRVALLEVGILLSIYLVLIIGTGLLSKLLGASTEVLQQLAVHSQASDAKSLAFASLLADNAKAQLPWIIILLISIFLLSFLIWCLGKYLVYLSISKKKFNKKTLLLFIPYTIVWSLIVFVLLSIALVLVDKLVGANLQKSIFNQAVFIILMGAFSITMFYLTISLFTHLIRTNNFKKSIKQFWLNLRNLDKVFNQLGISFLVFAGINIFLYIIIYLSKTLFTLITGLIIFIYFIWMRYYFTYTIK